MIVKHIFGFALFAVGFVAVAEPIKLYTTGVYLDVLDIFYVGSAAGAVALTRGLVEPLRPALGGLPMPIFHVVGGLVAVALLVYLVVALLKPEKFS